MSHKVINIFCTFKTESSVSPLLTSRAAPRAPESGRTSLIEALRIVFRRSNVRSHRIVCHTILRKTMRSASINEGWRSVNNLLINQKIFLFNFWIFFLGIYQRPYRGVKAGIRKRTAHFEADLDRRAKGVARIIVNLGDVVTQQQPEDHRNDQFRDPRGIYCLKNYRTQYPHREQNRNFNNGGTNKHYRYKPQNKYFYRNQY